MNNPQESPRSAVRDGLGNCFVEIRLARATELAQSERFADAAAVLMESGALPDSARELDLLARIAARQAHFQEARQLWTKASQLDPQNQTYTQCLKSLTPARQMARMIAKHESKLWNLLVLVIVVFVIVTLLSVFRK